MIKKNQMNDHYRKQSDMEQLVECHKEFCITAFRTLGVFLRFSINFIFFHKVQFLHKCLYQQEYVNFKVLACDC